MGLLKSLLPIVGSVAGNLIAPGIGGAIGGALGGALGGSGSSQSGTAQTNQTGTQVGTQTTTLDPAIAKLLGTSGSGGILGSLGSSMNGGSNISGAGQDFVNANAGQILNNGYATSDALANDQYSAPTIQAAQINAPAQNGMNLTSTFQSMLGGGNNTALRDALQYGTDLSNTQFQKNQTDVTNNLMRNVMPSIRSNSVLAGQYGGSRQGIAEGNALSDYTNQLTNANTQLGLANSANTTGQLASDYEQGQNRALSAAQGLSQQQYATAMQDAAARQAGDNTNVNSALSTNSLNASKMASGVGLQQGLLGTAANYGNADLSRLGQTAGILAPFLGAGATTSTNNQTTGNVSQPLYQNTAGNLLGGGLLGSALMGGGSGSKVNGAVSNLFDGSAGDSIFKYLGMGSSL